MFYFLDDKTAASVFDTLTNASGVTALSHVTSSHPTWSLTLMDSVLPGEMDI